MLLPEQFIYLSMAAQGIGKREEKERGKTVVSPFLIFNTLHL